MTAAPMPVAPPPIRARLLGRVELAVGERPLPPAAWPRRAARALLLMLLVQPEHSLSRDHAIDALWPEAPPGLGPNNLSKALHSLRRVLEPQLASAGESAYVTVTPDRIGLRAGVVAELDLTGFTADLAAARRGPPEPERAALRGAVERYRGELLAEEADADWVAGQRERLRLAWQAATVTLAVRDREAGEPLRSLPALEAVLATDPTDEAASLALMRALAAGGDLARALRAYVRCAATLEAELGVAPGPELAAFANALRAAPRPAAAPPRRAALPVPPTPLLGRERELEAAEVLLGDRVRLLTLTGPGGIGKTHLALAAGRALAPEFADGAVFVSLAPLRDPNLVPATIARALGVEDPETGPTIARIAEAVADASLLLVIDNVEPVLAAAPLLAELLALAPRLRLLATSRERLHVRGEHELEIPPLPSPAAASSPAAIADNPAARLFADRVAAARPGFALDAGNAAAVAAICRRLDGIPLALELAAARGRDLAPDALLARLAARVERLDDGPRDLPARLRTMRDAVAWSLDLLTPDERAHFRRLSVFAAGFDAAAATWVMGDGSWAMDGGSQVMAAAMTQSSVCSPQSSSPSSFPSPITYDPSPTLRSLVAKSLVRRVEAGGTERFRLLEPIRDCALDELHAAGKLEATRRTHAGIFAALADAAADGLETDQRGWIERLDAEIDNLRAAVAWSLASAEPVLALRIAVGTERFWRVRGLRQEATAQLEAALAAAAAPAALRVAGLLALAAHAGELGRFDRAEAAATDAMTLAAELGPGGRRQLGLALGLLATIITHRSEYTRAAELGTQALAIGRELDDLRIVRRSLLLQAAIAFERGDRRAAAAVERELVAALTEADPLDHRLQVMHNLATSLNDLEEWPEAERLCEQTIALARRHGYPEYEAWARTTLGFHAYLMDDLDRAEADIRAAAVIQEELGMTWPWAANLANLALVELKRGNRAAGIAIGRRVLATMHVLGDRRYVGMVLAYLGGSFRMEPTPAENLRLLAAGEAELAAIGIDPAAALPAERGAWHDSLRAELGEAAFADAWAVAVAGSVEAAVNAVLASGEPLG